MIFIFTALYPEAKPLITMFGLKKRTDRTRFQQFVPEEYIKLMAGTNEREGEDSGRQRIRPEIVLVVTGVGPVNAAAAVSSALTEYDADSADQLLSFGTAAALHDTADKRGKTLFLINKILDQNADRCFYPDMLLETDVPETSVVTGSQVLTERAVSFLDIAAGSYELYDMEAAAVYQTGAFYMGPHQMSFLRVVTDRGISSDISDVKALARHVTESVEGNVEQILDYVEKLRNITRKDEKKLDILGEEEKKAVEKVIRDAHFSKVMQDQFIQYVKYGILSGANWMAEVKKLYDSGILPTIDKRNGKKVLDAIRNIISE